jgi:hypothetical protein
MPPPNWNIQPYVGCYVHAATSTTVVITASGRKLTLVIWGTANMPIGIVPYNYRSSLFPADLFPIAQCWPQPNVEGRADSMSFMYFKRSSDEEVTQGKAIISGFEWKDKHFESFTQGPLRNLANPVAPLLRLPMELRSKIYGYLFENKDVALVSYGNSARFSTRDGNLPAPVRLDGIKDVCRQLFQETKGIYLAHARISTNRPNFMKLIRRTDALLHGRMQNVNIKSGFEHFIRNRDVADRLFPIIDFCLQYPHINVRLIVEDFRFDNAHPVAFIRTGMVIREALRGNGRICFKDDEQAVEEWRGGRSLARLDAPKMRIVAYKEVGWEGMNGIERRVRALLKNKHVDMKRIMRVYAWDQVALFRDILAHYDQGI